MTILNSSRPGLGGGAVGAMRALTVLSSAKAPSRQRFYQPIGNVGLIREKNAQMALACIAPSSWWLRLCKSPPAAVSCVNTRRSKLPAVLAFLPFSGGTNKVLGLYIVTSGFKDLATSLPEPEAAVDDIVDHPISGHGVLSDGAKYRLTHATGVAGNKIAVPLPATLKDSAALTGRSTVELSRAYAGSASLPAKPGTEGERAVSIARLCTRQATHRMANEVGPVARNEDDERGQSAGFTVQKGSYPRDVS